MKPCLVCCIVLFGGVCVPSAAAAGLPAAYFPLLEAATRPLEVEKELKPNGGVMLAAAVLYAKQHPANASFHDKKKLALALALGDLCAGQCAQDTAENKQDYEYRMRVPAGIRKTGPWTVCLSGLIDAPIQSQFTLDRQANLSIFHERLGLIITGANSKHQPELATFREKTGDQVRTIPLNSRLRMSAERDRLGLAYETFFAEIEVPKPAPEKMPFRFLVTETGRNCLGDVHLGLQLVLTAGETLETGRASLRLDEKRVELGPEQIGGWIRHHGWTLRVDPAARLVWPVFPFSPYRNGPETDVRHAVGSLWLPVQVQPPPPGGLDWRRGEIAFTLEARP
jgi:hypothetical protein